MRSISGLQLRRIAYNSADLDDGFEANLLSLEQIRAGVPVFARYLAEVEAIYPQAAGKLKFNETIKRILDRMVGDLILNTARRIEENRVYTLEDVRRGAPPRVFSTRTYISARRSQTKRMMRKWSWRRCSATGWRGRLIYRTSIRRKRSRNHYRA